MDWQYEQEMYESYKYALKKARAIECTDAEEEKIKSSMISDLEYTLSWLKKGYDPKMQQRTRGIFRKDVGPGGYARRKVNIPNYTEIFGTLDEYLEILSNEGERELTNDEKIEIQKVLRKMTERQITCFLLYTAHMRTMQEIATELGVTKATVFGHIESARKVIAEHSGKEKVS